MFWLKNPKIFGACGGLEETRGIMHKGGGIVHMNTTDTRTTEGTMLIRDLQLPDQLSLSPGA